MTNTTNRYSVLPLALDKLTAREVYKFVLGMIEVQSLTDVSVCERIDVLIASGNYGAAKACFIEEQIRVRALDNLRREIERVFSDAEPSC